jgi:hypothetical protein
MPIRKRFIAPALPLPTKQYEQNQQDNFIRALRLYFNLLDDYFNNVILDALNGGAAGNGITLPHIAASDSTDQRTTDNTATVVNWNTLDSGYGWTLNAPGSAIADIAGVYKITYSLQFVNTDNAVHYVAVWPKVNNNDVANSSTIFHVPARKSSSPGEEGYATAYSEVTFTVDVGDEIELYWATNKADVVSPAANGVYMLHEPAQTTPFPRPAVPSAIGSITFVSAIP